MSSASTPRFQLTPRDLLLLFAAIICGIGTGLLLAQSNLPVGQAIVAGVGATAAALAFLDRITKRG